MKTADPELMRAINRFHVLDTIRRHGPLARIEISEHTELSSTTVSAITASLIDDGLIAPRHVGDIRNGGRGRPRVMLELNPGAARVVGAKVSGSRLVFAVTNFQGDVLAELVLPVRVDRQPPDVIADLIEDGVRRCAVDAGLALEEISTVAIAVPGVVEHGTGCVRSSPIFQGGGVMIAEAVRQRLGRPTIVEGEANAIAMAEHWFGHGRAFDDFVLVSLEQSLGLGVMHGGQLFRGARGLSLNLGEMMLAARPQAEARLLAHAGEMALSAAVSDDGRLRDVIRLGGGMARLRELIDAGDNQLGAAAAAAGEALGVAIGNLVGLFAPPRVILVGSALVLGDHLLASLRSALAAALPPALEGVAELIIDPAGDEVWARGAAAIALCELYGAPWSTTGPARRMGSGAGG
jgi:predicted NBD/HSP70 family sugar kinase